MAKSEPDSQELFDTVEEEFKALLKRVDEMEFRRMLSGPDDACAAVMTLHPGAGGTEAHDWASMLLRMYKRFLEREGMDFKVIDVQEGEEAGIGSATIEMHKDSIKPGQRVAIIDDLIATGGTIEAAIDLIEQLGGKVVKIVFLMELAGLKGREKLAGYDYSTRNAIY